MTEQAFCAYYSYLQTKNELDFVYRMIGNNLQLSVSPKAHRLGIIPIEDRIEVLPYHGVPVYFKKENRFDIIYLHELKVQPVKITEVFLKGDKENLPFYYQME